MDQDTHQHAKSGCACGCGTAGACSSKTWLIATVVIVIAVLAVLWFVREPASVGDAAPVAAPPSLSR